MDPDIWESMAICLFMGNPTFAEAQKLRKPHQARASGPLLRSTVRVDKHEPAPSANVEARIIVKKIPIPSTQDPVSIV